VWVKVKAVKEDFSIDDAKAAFLGKKAELEKWACCELSESDTRCKIIDFLLIEVLAWRETNILREPKVDSGFIDYVLCGARPSFVLEAKKNRLLFQLPKRQKRLKISGVVSDDKSLKAAILQARNYAVSKGITFCCVTNGTQFVFFRSQNDQGISFEDHAVFVFSSLEEIQNEFLRFWNCLSFLSVSEGLHTKLIKCTESLEQVPRFKRIDGARKSGFRDRNSLFSEIKEVVTQSFQDLATGSASDTLIERCYVPSARDSGYDQSLKAILKDRPTFSQLKITPLSITKKEAVNFDNQVFDKEVVLLLGGIGSGKTTFIHRFRQVIAKDRIDSEYIWVYVSFNKYSDQKLEEWVSESIVSSIETDYPSACFGSYELIKDAYKKEYERLKNGRLAPIFKSDPEKFELNFSEEIRAYEKEPLEHVSRMLKAFSEREKKRIFLVFDNADQFDSELQNSVFMLAHRLSEIKCSLIISIREESYWKNKEHGALSAFHTVNFYVEAPRLNEVLSRRFKYVEFLLYDRIKRNKLLPVFAALKQTLLGPDTRYVEFLEKLSPGEVRRPLEQLKRFFFSGHTNMDSLVSRIKQRETGIIVGFHEFLKAIALNDREAFDENNSDILNLYEAVGESDISNLNRLAVIGHVLKFHNVRAVFGIGFVRITSVVQELEGFGISQSTSLATIALLNSKRLFETENQNRATIAEAEFVRSTSAADYYVSTLCRQFSYIDLVIPGTSISDGSAFNEIDRYDKEITRCTNNERMRKLNIRLERARVFVEYLAREAENSALFTDLALTDVRVVSLVKSLPKYLATEHPLVIESAVKAFQQNRLR